KRIVVPILKAISWINDGANRPQNLKYREVFNIVGDTNPQQSKSIYNSVSNSSETREVILLFMEIQLKLVKKNLIPFKPGKNVLFISETIVNPYTTISSQFLRIRELIYRSQLNYFYFKNVFGLDYLGEDYHKIENSFSRQFEEKKNSISNSHDLRDLINDFLLQKCIKKKSANNETVTSLFEIAYANTFGVQDKPSSLIDVCEFLIADSVFCLTEAIRALKVFRSSYMTSHSYMAYTQKKLGDWSEFYRNLYRIQHKIGSSLNEQPTIKKSVEQLIGVNSAFFLQKSYYYELACLNLYSTIEVHNEGPAYRRYISNMYSLEDDFNDNFYHFCCGLERFKVNIGAIKESAKSWGKVVNKARPFTVSNYLGQNPNGDS
ncbi:MAG: hypothetical protein AAFY71_27150, partial [Bacteroidota bacterium]